MSRSANDARIPLADSSPATAGTDAAGASTSTPTSGRLVWTLVTGRM